MIPSTPNELFTNEEVDLNLLPKGEALHLIHLEPAYRWVRYLSSILVTGTLLFFGFLLVILEPHLRPYAIWLFLVMIVLGIWNVIYHGVSFSYMGYAIREKDITYTSGWLWKDMTTIPFNRVQHCDIKRGLLDRQFGLSRLTIYTAGGQNTEVVIPGLLPDTAEKVKTFILHGTEHSIESEN